MKDQSIGAACRRLAGALALTTGAPVVADELAAATPYRPTVSNPAELSAPGWLEIEAGLARSAGAGAARQNNTPWLAKLAFSDNFGVMLGGDLQVRQTDADAFALSGRGDTSLAFKHRWASGEKAAFGLEWGVKFDTAAAGLGSGRKDYGVNAIVSRDIGAYRVDANFGATRLGLAEAGLARHQYPWALGVSRGIGESWSLALEVSGVARHGAAATTQLLLATGYSIDRRLVVDAGVVAPLSDAAPKWSVFAGVTWLALQFW